MVYLVGVCVVTTMLQPVTDTVSVAMRSALTTVAVWRHHVCNSKRCDSVPDRWIPPGSLTPSISVGRAIGTVLT